MTLPTAARGAAGHRAVRRAAARRARPAQRQREPLRARRRRSSPTSPPPSAAAAGDAQPLPRPRVHRAARGAGGVPRRDTAGVTPEQVWAANGSNEVMLQLLQAFGGPGRTALSLRADVLDVSRVRPRHDHRVGRRPPRERLLPRPRPRPRAGRASSGRRVVLLPSPEQPDRHRAAARGGRRRCARPAGDGLRRRRRGVRRVPPRRHARARSSCCRGTATWSSPAP